MRDTCFLDKVFVRNTEYKSNISLLYLNYYRVLNVISNEEDDDDVQDNDLDEDTAFVPEVPNQYEKVYSNLPTDTHMLKPIANCEHCDAKRFEHEPPGFGCRSGKVELNELNIPDELMSSNDSDARHFCNNIRFFQWSFLFHFSILSPR
jgi:hypothetical protein